MSVLWFSAELERARLEEEKKQEDERKMLREMDESTRIDYLQRKAQEEERRKKKEEDDKKAEEEAALLAGEEAGFHAELLARYSPPAESGSPGACKIQDGDSIHGSNQWRDDGWGPFFKTN